VAADLYRSVPRARQREFDLAVAACALTSGAALWALDTDDFQDVPALACSGCRREDVTGTQSYGEAPRPVRKWTRLRMSSSLSGWAAIVMVPSRSETVLALRP
jgi:hypothetical protein